MLKKNPLDTFFSVLDRIQEIVLVISFVLLVIGTGTNVVTRYFLNTDIFGMEELILVPSLWLYFIGASYATSHTFHIRIDLIDTYLTNKKAIRYIKVFTTFVSLVVVVLMSYWVADYVIWTFEMGSASTVWNIPTYITHGIVLLGFILMNIYLVRDFLLTMKKADNIR